MARDIDPYQWESMKRLRTANPVDSILKVMEHFSGMNEREGTRLANEGNFIQKQLDSATGMDDINRLSVRAQSYNTESAQSGFDYNIDYQNKKERFEEANMAYETGKKYVDMGLGDAKVQAENIMKLSWKDVAKEKNDLLNLKDGIAKGAQSNFDYKANGIYSQTGVLSALDTRLGNLEKREMLFQENEKSFIVTKPDGTMDEESQKIFEEFQYRIISGDVQEFDKAFDDYTTTRKRDYNTAKKSYMYWYQIEQELIKKQGEGETLTVGDVSNATEDSDNLSIFNSSAESYGKSKNDYLSLEWVIDRRTQAKEAAEKYNKQYLFLTGDDIEEERPWDPVDRDNRDIPGLTDSDPLYSIGDSQTGLQQDKQLDEQFAAGAVAEETPEGVAATEKEMEAKIGKDFDVTTGEHAVSEADFDTDPDWMTKAENETGNINKLDTDTEEVSSGVPWDKIGIGVGTGVLLEDKIRKVGTYTKNQVIKGAKYIRAVTGISGANIDRFYSDKGVESAVKEIGALEDELKGLKKGSKEYQTVTARINKVKNSYANKFAKKFKTKTANVKKLFNNTSKWNIFNIKADITTRFPKVAGKIFGKVGSVAGPFAMGSMIVEGLGADTWGEKIAGGVISTAAAKKFFPKLKSMLKSPAGKKFLVKQVGKKAATKIGTSIVAGAGWASLITGLAGTGLAAYDIYNAIKNWKE